MLANPGRCDQAIEVNGRAGCEWAQRRVDRRTDGGRGRLDNGGFAIGESEVLDD